MAKFLVLFLVPPDVIDNWRKTDEAVRQPAEAKMHADWGAWMQAHGAAISGIEAAGRTKSVSQAGVADVRNAIVMQGFVEAGSQEAAAQLFVGHPHLTIPQSSIEIMEVRAMGGGA